MKVTQLCPTLCDPMDYTAHGILQARILEWVAFPSPVDIPNPGIKPGSPALQVDSLPAELLGKPLGLCHGGSYSGYGYTTVTLSGTKTPAPEGHDQGSCRLCLGHHPALLTIRLYPARPHPADSGQQQPEEGSWARSWAAETQTGDPQQLPTPDPEGTSSGLWQAGDRP